ncbi:MAG TPA: carboxypeptidase-like regulatory domain-containing protein, partial [Ignavibacteria bacterium]|nr:carboxypeptidase-like regulatory domain-containing protein [Ignavibacteria bacterium]
GKVLLKNTDEPISYASVTIMGKPIGTATNEQGEFTLNFPHEYINDSLHISSLGYKPYIDIVSEVIENSTKTFYLDTVNIPIQPIYVLSKGETAEQIVNKAIKNIKKNYPTRLYYLDAFYREISMRDDRYARLVEAAVSIQDFGYDTDLASSRLRVNEIRKSNDYLTHGRTSKMVRRLFGSSNLLLITYNYDFIRAMQNCSFGNFLCKENFNRFEFEIKECTYNESGLVYIIYVRDRPFDEKIKKIYNNLEGTLYIQAVDYAIIKLDYGMVASGNHYNPYFFQGKYLAYSSVNYKNFNGKYYPEFIRAIRPIASDVVIDKTDEVTGKQYTISTLLINNIATSRRGFNRIKNREREQPKVDLYEKKFPYNPVFWENYNILLLDPNLKSVIHDLEEEIPLEKQFKLNGK